MSPRSIARGLWRLLRPRRAEQDLTDEVEHYVEMAAEEHMRAGLARDDAWRRARIDFGGIESAKELVRTAHWDGALETLRRDVAYALRGLRRNPGFTIVAVLALALGVGANTAMFSVIDAVMLRPLPYHDAGRLALIHADDVRRGLHEEALAYRTIQDLRADTRAFEDIASYTTQRAALMDGVERERTRSAFVSGNLFSVLGVAPVLGRAIVPSDEERGEDVAVISYGLWTRRYNADPSAVGQVIRVDGGGHGEMTLRIVGIMPSAFYFPNKLVEVWTPATKYWRFTRESTEYFAESARRWTAVGRLEPGTSYAAAASDLAAIGQRLASAFPATTPGFPGFTTRIVPILDSVADRGLQRNLWLLLGAVGLVLLVACANVANLLLARGATREREFAIRRAIGAGRSRLVRQLLAESLVLAVIGGALGIVLAAIGTRVLSAVAAAWVPRLDEIAIDARVLLFAAAVSLGAGIIFGVVPALRVSAGDVSKVLKDGHRASDGPSMRRLRGVLVVVECSLAVVVLAGAGLLLRSLQRMHAVDPGFNPKGVLAVRLEYAPETVPPESATRSATLGTEAASAANFAARLDELTTRLAAMPGVQSVGYVGDMFVVQPGNKSITIPGRTDDVVSDKLDNDDVSPGFFPTMGVPIVRGRNLMPEDVVTKIRALWQPIVNDRSLAEKERLAIPEPVVVNEAFVRRFFPNEDPIGRRFCIDPTRKTYWYTIVGVAGDMRRRGLERDAIPEYFGPYLPSANGRADLLVRASDDPLRLAPMIRQVISAELPGTIVVSATTADQQLGDFAAQRDLQTGLLTLFGALAVILAAIGIYGVSHYAVAERTREMGVRMALGASPAALVVQVIREGVTMPLVGIALGAGLALSTTRLLSHLLFGVAATDPLTFTTVLAALVGVAFVACVIPARRAARVDPLTALRSDFVR